MKLEINLKDIASKIADSYQLKPASVTAAIDLLNEGNTLPFIARYRKEATAGLTETQLRVVQDGLERHQDLVNRKNTILATIDDQGVLTDGLRQQIIACEDKSKLEDIYLPYKPKRRTKATIARESGLQPLADLLMAQQRMGKTRTAILRPFINVEKNVPDADSAITGAGYIVAETWVEDAQLRRWLFEESAGGKVTSKVKRGKKEAGAKFENYFDFCEPIKRIASHRFLAIKRGESEGVLRVAVELDQEYFVRQLKRRLVTQRNFELYDDLVSIVESSFKSHFLTAASQHHLAALKEKSDREAIEVFAKNMRELLMAPPAGKRTTIGLDPGFRTGCKVAVVDGTGKFLETNTIFPTAPKNDVAGAAKTLLGLIKKHDAELIAIGNGTASRETDAFVGDLIKQHKLGITKVIVNESGASIYSASPLAVEEYPDLDVTVRGAISIAHRLQDPLAELVKIDAKSIGVGQYQHDVNQTQLQKSLGREVESCVNSVGVELNTASASLLSYVAGIGPKLAGSIVKYRDHNGEFESRSQLLKVPKLGRKAFTQSAGFLRIASGSAVLDGSAVHPESYYVAEKMAKSLNVNVVEIMKNPELASRLAPRDFVDEKFGEPTVRDIISEMTKPGRDPRKQFEVVRFDDSVNKMSDLKEGMILQGQITNVTNFGAFVDVGVHQDGLVHVSQLADRYVADPAEVVTVGDVVRVKVMEVDVPRKRIGLSIKEA
jgi:uncharacterized protein